MKNSIRKFFTIFLVVLMLGSVLLGAVACKEEPTTPPDENTLVQQFSYESDKWIVKEGICNYVLVMENSTQDIYLTAAEEFRKFFAEATGCSLAIYTDGDAIPADKKIISLGETSYAKAKSLTGASLPTEAFRILTSDDNIFIVGKSGYGVLWGVYKILRLLVNYEFFKEDCYSLNTGVQNLNLCKADWTEAPDINYTPGYHGLCNFGDGIKALRYRLRNQFAFSVGNFHNALQVLDGKIYNDPSITETYHPSWYSTTGDQVCYTARGNQTELDAMVDVVADYFVEMLLADQTKTHVLFQMMDNRSWCECSACIQYEEQYKAKSAGMLIMSKKLHDVIEQKLKAENDNRDIYVVPMLYNASEDVPVVKDEDGNYKLTGDNLNFEGVIPLWAAMSAKVHSKPWQDEANASAVEMLNKLNYAFPTGFWLWDYGTNFRDYFVPFNIFDNIGEDFKFLQNYNIDLHLYQLDHKSGNATGFSALKNYLLSQLMWNADQDVEVLTDKFFENVYGDGANAMKQIYDSWLNLCEYNSVKHGDVLPWDNSIYSQTMLDEDYYPRGIVREWLDLIDQAYDDIASVKATSPSLYATYEYNIKMDSLFVRYIYATLYLTANIEENIQFKLDLYNDVAANFSQVSEGGNTWDFAKTLGIDHLLV